MHVLQRIRSLIIADDHVFDDVKNLKNALQNFEIVFDEDSSGDVIALLRDELLTLRGLVYKDELTGILNRRGVYEEFGAFFREALFYKKHQNERRGLMIDDFSVIFMDLDNFKSVNDRFGHDEGDRVLKGFAGVLRKYARETDAVGRFGGEEFVVGLLGASEDEAYEKAEQLRLKISETILVNGTEHLTASFGVASLGASEARTLDGLIHAADMAMYDAKLNRGKNATAKYSDLMLSE